MVKKILLENFKAFKNIEIELKPLTILVGPNNGGKSSILKSIALIKQTLNSSNSDILTFKNIVNFGDFESILHYDHENRNKNKEIRIRFDFEEGTYFDVKITKRADKLFVKDFSCNMGEFEYVLQNIQEVNDEYLPQKYMFKSDTYENEIIENLELRLDRDKFFYTLNSSIEGTSKLGTLLDEIAEKLDSLEINKNSSYIKIDLDNKRPLDERPLDVKIKYVQHAFETFQFYLSIDKYSRDFYQNIKQKFEDIQYINPIRDLARRSYPNENFENIGYYGEHAVQILANNPKLRTKVENILRDLDIAYNFEISSLEGQKTFEFKLKPNISNSSVNFADVGCGTSQILPIIVQILLSNKKTIVIEQPEVHLHPKVQAEFASFLVENINCESKFIIETHSEYFIERIRTCIMKNPSLSNDVIIYYVDQNAEKEEKITPIEINLEGQYSNLPEGYLTNFRMKEIDDQMNIMLKNLEKELSEDGDQ